MIRRNLMIPGLLSFVIAIVIISTASAFAQTVGTITELEGKVTVKQAKGQTVDAARDLPIQMGDEVTTTENGRATILFIDQSTMTLSFSTIMKVDKTVFNPDAKSRSSMFSVAQGTVMDWVHGLFGGEEEYKIETPTSVTGLRGTGVIVIVRTNPKTGKPEAMFVTLEGEQVVYSKANPARKVAVGPNKFTVVEWNDVPREVMDVDPMQLKELIQVTTLSQVSLHERLASFRQGFGYQILPFKYEPPEPRAFVFEFSPFGKEYQYPDTAAPSNLVLQEPGLNIGKGTTPVDIIIDFPPGP